MALPPSALPTPQDALRRFILAELAAAPQRSLDLDTPLFETLLDSTSVLALVNFLEQEFHIEVRDSEVVPAHFATLRCLCGYLDRKLQAAPLAAGG